MIRLVNSILVLLVAVVLFLLFVPASILYAIISFSVPYFTELFYAIAIGLDKIGNVALAPFLNHTAVTNEKVLAFGRVRHTISYVLAINMEHLTGFGVFLVNVLEVIDPGHMKKTLEQWERY